MRSLIIALALAVLALPAALQAQSRTTSAVRGTVSRTDGTPIPGAEVRIRHQQTGAQRATLTNERGGFLVLLLQPGGPYTITAMGLGLSEERREGLILQVGEVTVLDFTLQDQAIAMEGLEVEVERDEIFNPLQVGPATLLTERVVEAIPLLSRDVMELALLSPLVKTTDDGGFSIAGQNDRYNAILVDGILNKDVFGLTSGGVPGGQAGAKLIPIDAVSQYEILVAPFDVRLSGFTGGVLNAVTRSGTNDWRIRAAAVTRQEALMGDLVLPTGPVEASGVDRSLLALSVGGPIIRDQGHFFVAGEFERRRQPPAGYNLFRDDPTLVRIGPDNLDALQATFRDQFGVETGTGAVYPLEQELANVFARVDWNFEGGSRLTVRNVFSHAGNDESPNRTAFEPYELSSNGVYRSSSSNTTSFQLFSPLGDWGANQLDLNVQRITDRSTPESDLPQVEVGIISSIDGSAYRRSARLGGNYFAQANDLAQTSYRLTNAVDIFRGDDVVTLGVTASYYDINHTFLPGARGEYFFPSITDVEANAPQRFQRTIIDGGGDPQVNFGVVEWGGFAQSQLNAGKGLSMRFGLRLDVPHVLDAPETNTDVLDYYGYDTGDVPSGNLLISPRWGFNWQSEGQRRWQVRGGAGMFAGQIPYVWLANAFHNDGVRSVTQQCFGRVTSEPPEGNTVPPWTPGTPPESCVFGDFTETRSVVVFPGDFRYPQDLKFSATVDREITDRVSGSLGFLFNKALNQIGVEELNIEGGSPAPNAIELGGDARRFYQPLNNRYSQVLALTNEGEDWAFSVSAELRGRLTEQTNFQLAYALSRSWDRMSLMFTDMASNFGYNPVLNDANRPPLATSNFDRPHKFVATVFGRPIPGLPDTEISLLYTGQSGLPFSYVYRLDLNGDGYPGVGGAFDRNNDLLYVPNDPFTIPASIPTQALFAAAIRDDDCIGRYQGRTMDRNGCRSPWQNRLDLRLAQHLRVGGAEVRFEGDLINVLNLLNQDWGRVESIRPIVPILEPAEGATGVAAQWGGAVFPQRDAEGRLRITDPWSVLSPDSQWQLQFGARVTFGGEGR